MQVDQAQPGRVRLNRQFPILRIFDAAGIALAPASLAIAALAALILQFGLQFVDQVIRPDQTISIQIDVPMQWPWDLQAVPGFVTAWNDVPLSPWTSVINPAVTLLKSRTFRANGVSRLVLALTIWSLIGVILCRRTGLIFSGDDDATVRQSVRYGVRRFTSALGAPLIPLSAALLIGILLLLFGIAGAIPVLGRIWFFLLSPLIAILGFVMAFLLLATAIGWPLMVASISADDCDSFGGLSRAYSGITGRPWHLAAYVAVGLLVGQVVMRVASFVGYFAIDCALRGTSIAGPDQFAFQSLSAQLKMYVGLALAGVAVSYFWSASTIIYLLLRQDVDGIPLDRIAADASSQTVRDPLPVVGIPATDARQGTGKNVDDEPGRSTATDSSVTPQ